MAVSGTGGFGDDVRAWLAECLPRAIVYARSLVRDASEADDVVQECVYRLLKRSASYDVPRDAAPGGGGSQNSGEAGATRGGDSQRERVPGEELSGATGAAGALGWLPSSPKKWSPLSPESAAPRLVRGIVTLHVSLAAHFRSGGGISTGCPVERILAGSKTEIERYLSTGHSDPLLTNWPGDNVLERSKRGEERLKAALLAEVRRRAARVRIPRPEGIPEDLIAFARTKLEPTARVHQTQARASSAA